jgi:hypothetical protein
MAAQNVYNDQMFNLGGAAVTTLTSLNAGTTAVVGPYLPQTSGTLLTINIYISPQAASSLAQSGRLELTQSRWNPNVLRFPFTGFGLATAPQLIGGTLVCFTRPVNQPVDAQYGITAQVIYFFSPVTPNIVVEGVFSGAFP